MIEPGLLDVGYVLEFTSQAAAAEVTIYRYTREADAPISFEDYVVQTTELFILLEKTYERLNEPALGTYISLKTFLMGLYEEHKPYRPFSEFLTEFRQYLPLTEQSEIRLGEN